MKRVVAGLLALYSCVGHAQTETSKNLLTATTASNNIAFNAEAGTYRYSFQTGSVTAVGVLPVYDPLQVLTLQWSFDALYNCNNQIGGYCGDPNGTEDEIQAFLAVGNEAGDSDVREVFNRRDFNQEWQTFSGAEVYDFSAAYEAVSLRIDGVDRGFWAGNYGPAVRNPSVVAIYTPVNTNPIVLPDCSNPLNDPSCAGYADALAAQQAALVEEPKPPTFAEQATNVIFGDSPDDFLYLDQPDRTGKPRGLKQAESRQVYQDTSQETEMFGEPPSQARPRIDDAIPQNPEIMYLNAADEPPLTVEPLPSFEKKRKVEPKKEEKKLRQAEPDEIATEVARATRRPTEEVIARQDEVLPEPPAEPPAVEVRAEPVEVAATTRSEPVAESVRTVARPAVDVVGIALSLVKGQSTQSSTPGSTPGGKPQKSESIQQVAQVVNQSGAKNYWEMATQQTKVAQALIQQSQQQQSNSTAAIEVAPPSQAQFEDDFYDALATGQSVGQFLSAQPPDLSRFEIDEPTIQEQRMVQRATVAIKTMSQAQVEQSIDNQLDTLSETGGFTDQSVAVFLISNNSDFNQYQDVNLSDREEFYKSTQVYPKNAPWVDPFGVLRLGGSETFKELVDIQWQR